MPWTAHLYTIKIDDNKKAKVYVDAYHWADVEEIMGISRKQMYRGADQKTPWLTKTILSKRRK